MMIRSASYPDDLEALQRLSPPSVKPEVEFYAYATLVAEIDGEVAGYPQFAITPDKVLHSTAIRIGAEWKGQGVGRALMEEKVRMAREVGARMHFYAVALDGEVALKKILEGLGMHRCQEHGDVLIYVQSFGDA